MSKETSKDLSAVPKTIKKSDSTTALIELKQELGLWNGVGLIVGIMIGAGIFVSPGSVVRYTGSVGMSLVIWALTGLMSIMGALCYAELGTMIPKSGSSYAYVSEAFGPIPAFIILWINLVIVTPGSRSIVVITFATYLLQPIFPDCSSPPFWAVRLVGLALICIVGYINCAGVKGATKVQDTLTTTKVLALIVIIAVGLYHLAQGHVENFVNPMEGTIQSPSSIATAFYSTLFAYSGWNALNFITEELKDPHKNLPKAITISLTAVTGIYLLTNMAYFLVLTPAEIEASDAVAVTFGNRTLGVMAWIISIFVACSTSGGLNGDIIVTSRTVYAGARLGQLPRFLALIHIKNHTPVTAILGVIVIPSLMLLVSDVGSLLAYTTFTASITELLTVTSLLWMRYKQPERPRPIKVWLGFPILYLILSCYVALFPVVQRPVEIGVGVSAVLLGLLVYYFALHLKVKVIGDAMDKVTYVCQMVFQSVEEEKACDTIYLQ